MTAESECVGKGSTDNTLLSLVECEVEVIVNLLIHVVFVVVDSWRYDILNDRLDADQSLDSASSTEEVTSH